MASLLKMFLNGPHSDSPVLDSSPLSILYFVRDVIWFIVLIIPYYIIALIDFISPNNPKSVKGKIVVITGAGHGMGREYAKQFSALGSTVVCVDINEANNKTTVDEINSSRGHKDAAVSYICDVGDPDAVRRLSKEVLAKFGHVDILVSNAAILCGHSFTGGDDSFIQRVINVNLLSNFWMVRSFLPHMKEKKEGQIVFMNSISAFHGVAYGPTYCSSKSGLYGMVSSLREELRCDSSLSRIKITEIFPSFVETYDPKNQLRLKWRLPNLNTQWAVQQMIEGIRMELDAFAVPGGRLGLFFIYLHRSLPTKLYIITRNIFYVIITLPKESNVLVLPFMKNEKEDDENEEQSLKMAHQSSTDGIATLTKFCE